ncbi:MAG: PLP-dependent aminotransferase family protein [Acidobacteria bacterium]|nr:PLP-dependent aminotransferase family protein [Acidobacteriota bacterium]
MNRREGPPLYLQIRDAILDGVRSGRIPPGTRLPPTRDLAKRIGVNRTTVCSAYESLQSGGFAVSRVGRGTTILRADSPARARPRAGRRLGIEESRFSLGVRGLLEATPLAAPDLEMDLGTSGIDFSRLLPDERLFPVLPFRRAVQTVLAREGRDLLQYGPPRGHLPLREILAARLQRQGVAAPAERILVVSGAQQGIDLVFRVLLDPDDVVAVEAPTYSQVLPLLRFHRARAVGIPMTSEGMDLGVLERVLAEYAPKLVYTMPTRQNPTGVTTRSPHRHRLVALAGQHGVPILEDGFEEDGADGNHSPLLASLDPGGLVILSGTFSKGLFPGLRIGWLCLADPEILDAVAAAKSCSDYHTSLLAQAAVAEFCREGRYDAHLRRLGRIFRRRLRVALRALRSEFPRGVRWTPPDGGHCLWVELPEGLSGDDLGREAARQGVRIAPGRAFFPDESGDRFFRISISRVDEKEIREGVARIGRLLAKMIAGRRPAAAPAKPGESIPYI